MELVECVPNFSEGRRPDVIEAIRVAAESAGAWVLDVHSDAAHNRSVLTFAAAPDTALEAAFRCVERAARLIDMRLHRGEHPRIGAADVVPFVPLGDTSMACCVGLAARLGERIGTELGIPVYLYAEAARIPERRWLPNIRRGEYEGLARQISHDSSLTPDFGPAAIGSAGATVVGARRFLIAYNVNLRSSDLSVAADISRRIRQSDGGFAAVQARAMRTTDSTTVQVSMNLLDTSVTPAHIVFAAIAKLAAERGVDVIGAELVGLMPMSMSTSAAGEALGLPQLTPGQSVEYRVLEALLRASSPT
jgi:glutamate formiminotransferase